MCCFYTHARPAGDAQVTVDTRFKKHDVCAISSLLSPLPRGARARAGVPLCAGLARRARRRQRALGGQLVMTEMTVWGTYGSGRFTTTK